MVSDEILLNPQIFESSPIMHLAQHKLRKYLYNILPDYHDVKLEGRVQL